MDSNTPLTGPEGLAAQLAESIRKFSPQIDENGELPGPLIGQLRDIGAFSLLTPRKLGGIEAPASTACLVYEELARLDASVAWVVWNANFGFLGALLDEAGTSKVWVPGQPVPMFANSGAPGTAVPTADGFTVSGNWRIVSGINSADWLAVHAAVSDGDGGTRLTESGQPDSRFFLVPVTDAKVTDTWNTSGLRGTGSNDVELHDVHVPAELAAQLDAPPKIDSPLYRGFLASIVLPGCSAAVLGIAAAAVDELVQLAKDKRTAGWRTTLADVPRAQATIAESAADLEAARLLLYSAIAALEAVAAAGGTVTAQQRADLRAAMSHVTKVCRRVLVAVYELASSAALYRGNPIERHFRDGMTALQHVNGGAAAFEGAGRVRLGLEPNMPLF